MPFLSYQAGFIRYKDLTDIFDSSIASQAATRSLSRSVSYSRSSKECTNWASSRLLGTPSGTAGDELYTISRGLFGVSDGAFLVAAARDGDSLISPTP